jgi:large subunit ribosomal protein L29
MTTKELRDLSDDELVQKIGELRAAHMKLRFAHATAQLESPAGLKVTRRDIARAETVLTERRLAISASE